MAITVTQAIEAVRAAFAGIPDLAKAEGGETMTESISDTPMLKVWARGGSSNPNAQSQGGSFQSAVQQSVITIVAHLYAQPRGNLGQDMVASLIFIEAMIGVLQSQTATPFFGLAGIKGLNWNWSWGNLRWGDKDYSGAEFEINLRIF